MVVVGVDVSCESVSVSFWMMDGGGMEKYIVELFVYVYVMVEIVLLGIDEVSFDEVLDVRDNGVVDGFCDKDFLVGKIWSGGIGVEEWIMIFC